MHHTSMGNPSPTITAANNVSSYQNNAIVAQSQHAHNSSKPFTMHSARNSSGSNATTTLINLTKNSQIDRIVEELQGLTFEYSNDAGANQNQATSSTQ